MAATNKSINHNIRLAFFNANGIKRQKLFFIQFLQDNRIDIALLSETFLKPHISFKIPNYKILRNDRTEGRKGGTAVIIKSCLPFQILDLPPLETIEATAIKLLTTNDPIVIISVYKSPPKDLQLQDLKLLKQQGRRIIIAGDINAKNPLWHSRVWNPTGRRLEIFSNQLQLYVDAPKTPTHFPLQGGTPDVLDTCIYANVNILTGPYTITDLQSDHLPVLIEFYHRHNVPIKQPPTTAVTDWEIYRTHLAHDLTTIRPPTTVPEAEETIQLITKTINEELRKHTSYTHNIQSKDTTSTITTLLVKLKKFIRKKWQNTRNPAFKKCYNWLSRKLHNHILRNNIKNWHQHIEKCQEDKSKLWKLTRTFRNTNNTSSIKPLKGPNGTLLFSEDDKTALFANHLKQHFTTDVQLHDAETERQVQTSIQELNQLQRRNIIQPDPELKITPAIVSRHIKTIAIGKAPGDDNIPSAAIRKAPRILHVCLAKVFQIFLAHSHFPEFWKNAIVIMIAKPNKDHSQTQNYRPISLLSHIGKLYERIINTFLTKISENLHIIPAYQFGFRHSYDTQLQLLRIIDDITIAFNERQYTIATFLDVQGAFDKVWHDGLIFKLISVNIPHQLVLLIRNFLQNRTFQVKEGKSLSLKEEISAGVPQGSPLSPLLYNIYTADFLPHPGVKIATYADDTMLYTSQTSPKLAIQQMKTALQGLYLWTTKWKIKVNPNKSTVIIFTRRKKLNIPRFTFGHQLLNFNTTVKYLGVILDSKLTFEHHIQQIKQKGHQKIAFFYPIFLASKLSIHTKLLLYKSLIRSSMTYAGPVFKHASKCHLRHLQIIQNKCLRLITGHERTTRVSQLHEDTGLLMIQEHLQNLQDALWRKIRNFPNNHLITHIGTILPRRNSYRLPRPT